MTPSDIQPGMKFNHWTVIKFSHTNPHRVKYFLCKCDCGTERAVRGTSLISGESKACSKSCANTNLVGQVFGRLTVISKDKEHLGFYWCKCECGTECSVSGKALITGTIRHCGCLSFYNGMREGTYKKYKDYVGKQMEHAFILDLDKEKKAFKCRCECGNIFYVAPNSLVSGKNDSCGCRKNVGATERQNKLYESMIGQKINHLTILEHIYKNNNHYLRCQCDCGKEGTFLATKVKTGYIQSCGCLKSRAEEKMEKLLIKYKIPYKREYKFDNCRDKMPLPFDFALFNNQEELIGLIELNGQQHYTVGGWSTKEHLLYVQRHDKIKLRFTEEYKIPLLVIPYQYFDELEKFLITSDFWEIITKNFND